MPTIGAGKGVLPCRSSKPAIKRGELAGCPVLDGKNPDQRISKTDQSINSASLTKECFALISPVSAC